MTSLDYVHVDVFSDRPFCGNSLPVFFDCPELAPPEMLRITQELRHFEAVFLKPMNEAGVVDVRVFDLIQELPFAGHPLIGAAAVLQHRFNPTRDGVWHLALRDRIVDAAVRCTANGFSALLDQGRPAPFRGVDDRAGIAAGFSLTEADLDAELPLEVGSTGLRYLVVPVAAGALSRARITSDLTSYLDGHDAQFAVLFDRTAMELRHWNNDGVIEDVATGSAAGVVGAYAVRHGIVEPGVSFTFSQGRFVGRPSMLHVTVDGDQTDATSVKVGGGVAFVGRGTIDHRPESLG